MSEPVIMSMKWIYVVAGEASMNVMRNPAEVDKLQVVTRRLTGALIDRKPAAYFQEVA
jgi:hypothetical protein